MEPTTGEGLFISAMIPIAAAGLVFVVHRTWSRLASRPARDAWSREVIFIGAAKIATDLVPLIDDLVRPGSKLWILGADGLYFKTRNGPMFKDAIRNWVKKGMTIEYILLRPDSRVEGDVRLLVEETRKAKNHETAKGKFRVLVLGNDIDEIGSILREIDTRHPTLFFGSDGDNALWLEGLHRRNTQYAYNVRYISPAAMVDEYKDMFDDYEKKMQKVMSRCDEWPRDAGRMAA